MTDPNYAIETALPLCVLPSSSQPLNIRFHNGTRGTFSTPLTLVHNDVLHNPSHVTATASTFITNTLEVVSTVGSPLDTVTVSVALDNGEPITALQCDLHAPAGAAFIPGSLTTSNRSSTHSSSSSILSNGALRVILFSLTQATFTGSTGEVARFQMVCPQRKDPQKSPLIMSSSATRQIKMWFRRRPTEMSTPISLLRKGAVLLLSASPQAPFLNRPTFIWLPMLR